MVNHLFNTNYIKCFLGAIVIVVLMHVMIIGTIIFVSRGKDEVSDFMANLGVATSILSPFISLGIIYYLGMKYHIYQGLLDFILVNGVYLMIGIIGYKLLKICGMTKKQRDN